MIIFKIIYSTQEKGEYVPLQRLYLENYKLKILYNEYYARTYIAYTTYISVLSTHHRCKQNYKSVFTQIISINICIIHVNKALQALGTLTY